jgi:predicted transcriptional regulator of viral defense system
MRFHDFRTSVSPLPAFNLNDARKLDPHFHRQQLTDWVKRGYILPIAGGYYLLAERTVNEGYLYMLANRIYGPSYVSRESALAHYHIIPESVLSVTSVSARKTNQFESPVGRFVYNSIKSELMFGYRIVDYAKNIKFKIATLEKAVLDYLYWNRNIRSSDDFDGLRWNKEELLSLKDNQLFEKYLRIFDNQALNSRVAVLWEYIHA